jgi:hypothetical protein
MKSRDGGSQAYCPCSPLSELFTARVAVGTGDDLLENESSETTTHEDKRPLEFPRVLAFGEESFGKLVCEDEDVGCRLATELFENDIILEPGSVEGTAQFNPVDSCPLEMSAGVIGPLDVEAGNCPQLPKAADVDLFG